MKERVGTELSKMIPDWAVQFEGKCGCRNMQKKMDHWGVVGCTAKKDIIVAHLMEQSDKLIPAFKLVPDVAKRAIADRMVRMAIKRAREAS